MASKSLVSPRRLPILLAAVAAALLVASAIPVSSQSRSRQRALPPPNMADMERLLNAARQAGLNDEQIRKITVRDEQGNVYNVYEYVKAEELKQQREAALRREEQSKVYLTVRDVFTDLNKHEREDLDQLREQLPYLK